MKASVSHDHLVLLTVYDIQFGWSRENGCQMDSGLSSRSMSALELSFDLIDYIYSRHDHVHMSLPMANRGLEKPAINPLT